MKSLFISAAVAAGLLASGSALADKELATKKGCLACHQVDKKVVGPAYKDVAAKKKSNDELANSILKGSKGKYPEANGVAMPPNATVNPEEAKKLAAWINGGAK